MLGAQVGELAMPYYIGIIIDLMREGDLDRIGEVSAWMTIILIVSQIILIHKFFCI